MLLTRKKVKVIHSTQQAGAGVAPCAGERIKAQKRRGDEQRSTENKQRSSELVQSLNHL